MKGNEKGEVKGRKKGTIILFSLKKNENIIILNMSNSMTLLH
jgi:hypothetical protein